MTIIKIEATEGFHDIQSQSQRTEVWLEGYIEVPEALVEAAWTTNGYCDLAIEDDVLMGMTPTERPEPEPDPTAEIAGLKAQLSATDYQIIKCSEYQLAELKLPYDLAALHTERQALRDRINVLEAANEQR